MPESKESLCLFHEKDWKLKDEDKIGKEIKKMIKDGKTDFEGYILPGINFSTLEKKRIEQDINFRKACFKGKIIFDDITFKGEAGFSGATFEGEAWFDGTSFKGGTVFDGATFKGLARFSRATFKGLARFSRATFEGLARFSRIAFKGGAWFDGTAFKGGTLFDGTAFKGGTLFDGATFERLAVFDGATFERGTRFSRATFEGLARFSRIAFKGLAVFDGATFERGTRFSGTTFKGKGIFRETKFKGKTIFSSATFMERGIFEGISREGKAPELDFEESILRNVSFIHCNLKNTRFKNTIFDGAELSTSDLGDKIKEHRDLLKKYPKIKILERTEELLKRWMKNLEIKFLLTKAKQLPKKINYKLKEIIHKKRELVGEVEDVADTYRRIKQCLQEEGDYSKAGNHYIQEMELKRKAMWRKPRENEKWVKWVSSKLVSIFYFILSLLCGYGERVRKIIGWALIFIFGFTFYYFLSAGITTGGMDYQPSLWESFYFSIVTFTTLGYGDFHPKPYLWAQFPSMLEAGLGAFMIALFVVVFARKMMR